MTRLLGAVTLALLCFMAAATHRRALALRTADVPSPHTFVPSPTLGRALTVGENELAADLVWIRSLIYYGDGITRNTGLPDVDRLVALINHLDPWFRRPYLWGAHAVTYRKQKPTQEEFESSIEVLRRGVAIFPRDWELSWLLGLRLAFDLKPKDPALSRAAREEGAGFIEKAMRVPGAPSDLPLLAASLRTRLGQKERALREIREMILTTEDEKARALLQIRYAMLASEAASADLGADAAALDAAWKKALPYGTRTLYILIGDPAPSAFDLQAMTGVNDFERPDE